MELSLVIPVFNEEESLRPLVSWLEKVIGSMKIESEVIFIDDGSSDQSWSVISEIKDMSPLSIQAIRFKRNYGKSAALDQGFRVANGEIVITLDADMQDSPDEIPKLYKMMMTGDFDIISGWKKKRKDPISKTVPSKLFNLVARKVSGIPLHDFNCGLKAYSKEVIKNIRLYGDMHRWIPVLAKWQGYTNITEKVVEHRAREFGRSKFGAGRLISGFLDLLSIYFVGKFNKQPMHFFGTWGLLFFLVGAGVLSYLTISKFIFGVSGIQDRPLFFFGILILILGAQLFLTGFLAELVISNRSKEHLYNISDQF